MLNMVNPGGVVQVGSGTVFAPNNNRVIYVHHNLPSLSELDPGIAEYGRTSIPAAIDLVRTGRGDIIQLLPGHTESISSADYCSTTGTKTDFTVRGPATGTPATLTWTVTGSSWLLDTAGVVIDGRNNLILQMEPTTGSVNVAAPITISAARCKLLNLRCMVGTDSNNKVTIAVTTTAAADDLEIGWVNMYGATTAEATTFFEFVGADRLYMHDCSIQAATSAVGVGLIRFATTESLDIRLFNLHLQHKLAASETVITGVASLGGIADNIFAYVLDDDSGNLVINNAKGAFETAGNMQFGANCFVTNTIAETGAKWTAVSA